MGRLRPVFPGGGKVATTDGTATFIPRAGAYGFWVNSGGDAFIAVTNNNTAATLSVANATPIGAGLYGPFDFANDDAYIAVAGNGGTPTVTITLV